MRLFEVNFEEFMFLVRNYGFGVMVIVKEGVFDVCICISDIVKRV